MLRFSVTFRRSTGVVIRQTGVCCGCAACCFTGAWASDVVRPNGCCRDGRRHGAARHLDIAARHCSSLSASADLRTGRDAAAHMHSLFQRFTVEAFAAPAVIRPNEVVTVTLHGYGYTDHAGLPLEVQLVGANGAVLATAEAPSGAWQRDMLNTVSFTVPIPEALAAGSAEWRVSMLREGRVADGQRCVWANVVSANTINAC